MSKRNARIKEREARIATIRTKLLNGVTKNLSKFEINFMRNLPERFEDIGFRRTKEGIYGK